MAEKERKSMLRMTILACKKTTASPTNCMSTRNYGRVKRWNNSLCQIPSIKYELEHITQKEEGGNKKGKVGDGVQRERERETNNKINVNWKGHPLTVVEQPRRRVAVKDLANWKHGNVILRELDTPCITFLCIPKMKTKLKYLIDLT